MFDPLLPLGLAIAGAAVGLILDRPAERLARHSPAEALVSVGGAPSGSGAGCDEACRPLGARRRLPISVSIGAAWGLLALRIHPSWTLLAAITLAATVVPLAFCDYEHYLLPKRLVWPGAGVILGILVLATVTGASLAHLALASGCAVGAAGVLGAFWLASPRWLAFGDVRMAIPIGLAVGWVGPGATFLAILIANLGAGLTVGLLLATGRMRRGGHVPFGVFLAIGAITALLVSAH